MSKWRNFFLQRMGTPPTGLAYPVYESVKQWGVWCKDIPFKLLDNIKEPAKRSWPGKNGDDEYIGSDGLYAEAYSMEVEFGCKKMSSISVDNTTVPAVTNVRTNVGTFLTYLRSSGMLKLYSSYTRIGRQNVRLESVSDNATWKNENGQEFLVFKVRFKVNDPVTDIQLTE